MVHKILVVDDDPVVRMLITEYLHHYGHDVEVLENGRDCLNKLDHMMPDILVLDMLMPDMTGEEVLKNLRENPRTAQLPVIMLSADKKMAASHSSEEVHANCYLEKPFDIKEVLAAIDSLHKLP